MLKGWWHDEYSEVITKHLAVKIARLVLIACCMSFLATAQSVSVKKDIVYKGDQPYCKLVKSGGLTPRYSVRNLDDQELMVAQFSNEQQRYIVSFLGSGQVCYMDGTLGFGKLFAKDLAANNVIVGNAVNPTGERLFLQQYGVSSASAGQIDHPSPV